MTTLYRAGQLCQHHGRGFACATRFAAEKWAVDLGRPIESVQTIEVDGSTPCVVNTHGYVEADFRYGDMSPRPWDDVAWLAKLSCLAQVYRVEMTIDEAVSILGMLADDPVYQAHEIVWAM